LKSQEAHVSSKRYKVYASWFAGFLGGLIAGLGFFAGFILDGIKNEVDRSWVIKYGVYEVPSSSYYFVKTIELIGVFVFLFGIILIGIGAYWAYSSQK